jgi:hypothetical protein
LKSVNSAANKNQWWERTVKEARARKKCKVVKNGLAGYRQTTAKSQNACRRRNTGTSAILQLVVAAFSRLLINQMSTRTCSRDPVFRHRELTEICAAVTLLQRV